MYCWKPISVFDYKPSLLGYHCGCSSKCVFHIMEDKQQLEDLEYGGTWSPRFPGCCPLSQAPPFCFWTFFSLGVLIPAPNSNPPLFKLELENYYGMPFTPWLWAEAKRLPCSSVLFPGREEP